MKQPRIVGHTLSLTTRGCLFLPCGKSDVTFPCAGITRIRFYGCNLSLYLFSISTPSLLFVCKYSDYFSYTNMKRNFSYFKVMILFFLILRFVDIAWWNNAENHAEG